MGNLYQVLIFLLIQNFLTCLADMSCKGIDGRDVDWFVAIKFPEMRDSNRDISDGVGFVYADNKNPTFVLSNFPINSSLSAIGKTVNQALQAKHQEDLFYALYNDDHPNGKPDSYRGHLKGALTFDDFQGFWLIHSVPKYPDSTQQRYTYPITGVKYGQSFICVTFPVTSLNEIGEQLWFMQPSVYDYNLPESFKNLFPNLAKAVTKKALSGKKYANVANLMSKGGTEFTSFAKHKKFAKDLYADLVATTLRKPFYVETWLNGKGDDLGPSCNGTYNVYDVDRLQILGKTFVNSRDHSKWGISATSTSAIVCIGDINRQSSQAARGGGTMCVKNQQLWRNFKDAIMLAKCCAGQRSCLPCSSPLHPSPSLRSR